MTSDEVVATHSGTEFVVAFCGFAPGFAYCTGLPERLRRPATGLAADAACRPGLGRPGRCVHGRLPDRVARRLADHRHHHGAALGRRPRVPGPAGAGHAGEVRRCLSAFSTWSTAGPQTTVQDLGRPGFAHLGVPRSGALDQPAHRLANRLVGNAESAATLECLLGGVAFRVGHAVTVAVTGASVPGARRRPRLRHGGARSSVRAGALRRAGPGRTQGCGPTSPWPVASTCREVLGSRSTDLLSGIGPDVVADGDRLPGGTRWTDGRTRVRPCRPGRRRSCGCGSDRVTTGSRSASLDTFHGSSYTVTGKSNRIGLRLDGPELERRDDAELPSEGMVLGAGAGATERPGRWSSWHDHPTTGGYPVVGVVAADDLPACAAAASGRRGADPGDGTAGGGAAS